MIFATGFAAGEAGSGGLLAAVHAEALFLACAPLAPVGAAPCIAAGLARLLPADRGGFTAGGANVERAALRLRNGCRGPFPLALQRLAVRAALARTDRGRAAAVDANGGGRPALATPAAFPVRLAAGREAVAARGVARRGRIPGAPQAQACLAAFVPEALPGEAADCQVLFVAGRATGGPGLLEGSSAIAAESEVAAQKAGLAGALPRGRAPALDARRAVFRGSAHGDLAAVLAKAAGCEPLAGAVRVGAMRGVAAGMGCVAGRGAHGACPPREWTGHGGRPLPDLWRRRGCHRSGRGGGRPRAPCPVRRTRAPPQGSQRRG